MDKSQNGDIWPFQEFLDLGLQPISNLFPREPFSPPHYRLVVGIEPETGLVRLRHQPAAESMFNATYAFETRTSNRMVEHFISTANELVASLDYLKRQTRVLEVGSNDGVFLEACARLGAEVLGVDPSKGVSEIARAHGIGVREAFFCLEEAKGIASDHGKFDLAFAANALCHIPDLGGNLAGFAQILTPEGILVFEDPYLGSVLQKATYDQFYDEHYYMFSVGSVRRVALSSGLTLYDVKQIPTHGGSMRYFLSRSPRKRTLRLEKILRWERFVGTEDLMALAALARRADASRAFLQQQLALVARNGTPVIGLGAASKTVTVLNYCDVGSDWITYFVDSTPRKSQTYMAGTDIPVVDQHNFVPPNEFVAFIGAHNHESEILSALKARGIRPAGVLTSIPFSTVKSTS